MRPGKTRGWSCRWLPVAIDTLRIRGRNGARQVVNEYGSEKFVQLVKKIPKGKTANVIFGFPIAPWSTAYVEKVKDILAAKGIAYEVRKADRTLEQKYLPDFVKSVREFIEVDCGIDLQKMVTLAELSFEIFGMDDASLFDNTFFAPMSVSKKPIGFKE